MSTTSTVFSKAIDDYATYILKWAIRKGFRTPCVACHGDGKQIGLDGRPEVCRCGGRGVETVGPNSRNFAEQAALLPNAPSSATFVSFQEVSFQATFPCFLI